MKGVSKVRYVCGGQAKGLAKLPNGELCIKQVRGEPPAGTIRRICQTARRCFYPTLEVLNGSGKGVLKEAIQVFIQELNESELFDEVS